MSFLDDLANLLHHGQQPQQHQQHPQAPAHPMPLTQVRQLGPTGHPLVFPNKPGHQYEDEALTNGPQTPVPFNASIANFPMQPHGMPEDSGLIRGQQGYAPMNADIAHFNRGVGAPNIQVQPQMPIRWQNTDGQRRNMVNPQQYDNGFYFNQ